MEPDLNVKHLHHYTCARSNISQKNKKKTAQVYIGGNLWLILMLESLSCVAV